MGVVCHRVGRTCCGGWLKPSEVGVHVWGSKGTEGRRDRVAGLRRSQVPSVVGPAPYGSQLPEDALQKLLPQVEVARCQVSPEKAYTNAAQAQAVIHTLCCTPGSLGKKYALESDHGSLEPGL